jgi:AraC family transcriptional regulator
MPLPAAPGVPAQVAAIASRSARAAFDPGIVDPRSGHRICGAFLLSTGTLAEGSSGVPRAVTAVPCVVGHGVVIDELRVDGIRAIEVRHAPGLTIHSHAHDVPKLCVLIAGGATERIGLDLVEHGALEVVVRARLRPHENQYHAHGAHSLLIELEHLPALDGELDASGARLHGRRLLEAFRSPRAERPRQVRAAVQELVARLRPPRGGPAWLDAARDELFARIAEPPTRAELGRALGVHPVHVAHAFRQRWHITPRGFVRGHRVFRAIELIARGATLSAAALETGFADQSHMTRAIQQARRAPPGALRRTMRAARPGS